MGRDRDTRYGCIIFEDVFDRLDKTFDDEQLGRILRAAYNYGFNGVIPELTEPVEVYACSELQGIFDRNRESYDKQTIDGKVASAKRYAHSVDDLKDRLNEIDGLLEHQKAQIVIDWKKKHPDAR